MKREPIFEVKVTPSLTGEFLHALLKYGISEEAEVYFKGELPAFPSIALISGLYEDLSLFLPVSKKVRSLVILGVKAVDWKVVNTFSNLVSLTCGEAVPTAEFCPRNMTKLRWMDCIWTENLDQILASIPSLESLNVRLFEGEDLDCLKSSKKLKHLQIIFSDCLKSLDGIDACQNLEYLCLDSNSRLTDISAVAKCKSLRTLYMSYNNNVVGHDKLGSLTNLEVLVLGGRMPSMAWVKKLKKLRVLWFDCAVEDVDISFLRDMPSLEHLYFHQSVYYRQKNSFNEKLEDLVKELGLDDQWDDYGWDRHHLQKGFPSNPENGRMHITMEREPTFEVSPSLADGSPHVVLKYGISEEAEAYFKGELPVFPSMTLSTGLYEDLSLFLPVSKKVRSLSILRVKAVDWKVVNTFSNLVSLTCGEAVPTEEFCPCNMTKLRWMECHWTENLDQILASIPSLESLDVRLFKSEDLGCLRSSKKLKHLQIGYSRYLKSLDGIDACQNLELLWLDSNSRLTDISAVARCKSLRTLCMSNNKVVGHDKLASLTNLEVLVLGGSMPSMAWVKKLKKLRVLRFDCVVEDGDISFLRDMPSLEHVNFRQRRNLNEKLKDLVKESGINHQLADYDWDRHGLQWSFPSRPR